MVVMLSSRFDVAHFRALSGTGSKLRANCFAMHQMLEKPAVWLLPARWRQVAAVSTF
jgi:hypothetical protein